MYSRSLKPHHITVVFIGKFSSHPFVLKNCVIFIYLDLNMIVTSRLFSEVFTNILMLAFFGEGERD